MSLRDEAHWAAFPLVPELVGSLVRSQRGLAWTAPRLRALELEASGLGTEKLFEAMRGLLRLAAALEDTGETHAAEQLAPIIDRLAVLLERNPRPRAAAMDDEATAPEASPLDAPKRRTTEPPRPPRG